MYDPYGYNQRYEYEARERAYRYEQVKDMVSRLEHELRVSLSCAYIRDYDEVKIRMHGRIEPGMKEYVLHRMSMLGVRCSVEEFSFPDFFSQCELPAPPSEKTIDEDQACLIPPDPVEKEDIKRNNVRFLYWYRYSKNKQHEPSRA